MSHKAAKRKRIAERESTRIEIRRFALALIEAFQERFRLRAKEHYERFPNGMRPCATCALNPSTNDWHGQDNTAMQFATSLIRNTPFYCHKDAPEDPEKGWLVDPRRDDLCAGWWVILGDPDALVVASRKAFAEIGVPIVPGPAGDGLIRTLMDEFAAIMVDEEPQAVEA